MFNAISSFLGSTWEIFGQFPAALGGFEEEPRVQKPKEKPKVQNPLESPLAKRMEVVPAGTANGGFGLYRDFVQSIFRRLPPHELLNVGLVCRLWYQLSSEDSLWVSYPFQEAFPQATFIDKPIWEAYVDVKKYGWDMQDPGCPCVTKWDYIELKRMESAVERGLSFTVLWLFPGHKLNDAIDLAGRGIFDSIVSENFLPRIAEVLGEEEVKEPVVVAVTNHVFKCNRRKTFYERQLNCERAGILPIMDVAIMRRRISDPKLVKLFGEDRGVMCTGVKEKIDGREVELMVFDMDYPVFFSDFDDVSAVVGLRRLKVVPSQPGE